MRKRPLSVVLLIAASTAAGSAQQPTFPSRVELVTVDVVVFDRQGNSVEGLTREDFTIKEDGDSQTVAAFEAVSLQNRAATSERPERVSTNDARPDTAGRWFFVVFDDVNITPMATARGREALTQFIDRVLRPGDRVMIAPASDASNWTGELPQDREDLIAYVQRLQGERVTESGPERIWDHEAMAIALGRDKQAQAQVARRYYENNILIEGGGTPSRNSPAREALDVDPGIALIQTKARQTYTEARSRMQTSLGTLERLSAALADARGRKTLLFFSEGFIMDTSLPNFRTLLQAARNANVALHFVDVRNQMGAIGGAGMPGASVEIGPATDDRDGTTALAFAAREADGTRSIAADTGGSTISGTNLLAGLSRVANEGRAYYLLGYSPTNTRRDGRFRKIEVTVNRRDVTVRARGGYFEPAKERGAPAPKTDKLDPDVRAGLDSPFGATGIPLRLTSYVLGAQADGKVHTLLVAEADPAPLRLQPQGGKYTATLDSYVLVHDRGRDSTERDERVVDLNLPADVFAQVSRTGIPIQREFTLEPGRYQATVLLRDRATGVVGSVRHKFDVPGPNEFRMTTPVVTDVVQAPAAAGQAPRPVPIARRTFKAGSRIAAAFEIVGASDRGAAGPQVSVAYTLRRSDGRVVTAFQPQALRPNARGQFAVTIGVTLPRGASGDHELHISVRDEAAVRVLEHVEALTIAP
jgi:VWFA-related protein